MGAGWDQVRSRGPQFRSESGVDRIIRYLGGGALPAVLETVAVAVHLQDVNVVGEPVKQSAGEPLGAEHVGPLVEGQVGGDQDGAPFVALAEDLEEEFRTGGGEGDEAQLVDDEKPEAGQLPLQVEQPAIVSGLHELVDQGRGGGEAYGHSLLAGGQAQTQGHVGLAGATVADGDDILPMLDVFTPGQFHDQLFVHRGYGQEVEGVQAFDGRETGVPVSKGHRDVLVKGYVAEVVISCGAEVIARHPRSYERDDFVFDPIHYLPLLEQKTAALDQAAPLQGWQLPEEFATLRRLLESRMGRRGKREFVQVLRLLENFSHQEVHHAVQDALRLGAISFDAVKHLLLCHLEGRPPRLDLDLYPYLPRVSVKTTSAMDYLALLPGRAA